MGRHKCFGIETFGDAFFAIAVYPLLKVGGLLFSGFA